MEMTEITHEAVEAFMYGIKISAYFEHRESCERHYKKLAMRKNIQVHPDKLKNMKLHHLRRLVMCLI